VTSRSVFLSRWQPPIALALAVAASMSLTDPARSQTRTIPPSGQVLTIPYLGNVTRPDDLDYAAALCDVSGDGEQMHCRIHQVFLTPTTIDPTSCAITTSAYERTFWRQTRERWVSRSAPEGSCGRVETTTLEDGGGTRWTMTVHTAATLGQSDECRSAANETEVYDWRRMKRRLPCTSIQPGAIER
jgi:hypothetical protein